MECVERYWPCCCCQNNSPGTAKSQEKAIGCRTRRLWCQRCQNCTRRSDPCDELCGADEVRAGDLRNVCRNSVETECIFLGTLSTPLLFSGKQDVPTENFI